MEIGGKQGQYEKLLALVANQSDAIIFSRFRFALLIQASETILPLIFLPLSMFTICAS